MLRTRFLLALFLCVAADGLSHAQCVPEGSLRTETFSTIEEVKGQGPAGSELILDEQGERVIGTLKEYRGSPDAVKTKLTGSIEESESIGTTPAKCKVRLSGKDSRGPVEIEGEITLTRFVGTVIRHIGKETLSFRISLRRQPPLGRDDGTVAAVNFQAT
ncbi:MAG: hypothetical protein WBC78_20080 [Candidatus Sulfotelmatobacter sp.]